MIRNMPWERRKLSSWASGRPMRWQRWTICKNTGPIFPPPRVTCSTGALAELGRTDEALEEYHTVSAYFPGAEAAVRYGLLLDAVGRRPDARVVLNELLIKMKSSPGYLRKAQAEWLSIAEKQLST